MELIENGEIELLLSGNVKEADMKKHLSPLQNILFNFLISVGAGSHLKNQWKIRRPQRKSSARQEMRLDVEQELWPLKRIKMWRIELWDKEAGEKLASFLCNLTIDKIKFFC